MLRSPRLQLQLRLIATHSHLPVRYLTLVQHRLHAVRVAGRQAAPLRCPTNQKGIKRSSLDSGNPRTLVAKKLPTSAPAAVRPLVETDKPDAAILRLLDGSYFEVLFINYWYIQT